MTRTPAMISPMPMMAGRSSVCLCQSHATRATSTMPTPDHNGISDTDGYALQCQGEAVKSDDVADNNDQGWSQAREAFGRLERGGGNDFSDDGDAQIQPLHRHSCFRKRKRPSDITRWPLFRCNALTSRSGLRHGLHRCRHWWSWRRRRAGLRRRRGRGFPASMPCYPWLPWRPGAWRALHR